jgi:hypothetical protein
MPNGLTRRDLLRAGSAAAALGALPGLACRGAPPPGAERPNVLFVLSDSHRARSTGCYGNAHLATPNFDALAASGLKLTTAVANTPLCRPYRASLMSGMLSHHTGVMTNSSERNFGIGEAGQWEPHRLGLTTLGELFAAGGRSIPGRCASASTICGRPARAPRATCSRCRRTTIGPGPTTPAPTRSWKAAAPSGRPSRPTW